MPFFVAPTLHGLMMVLNSRNAAGIWCAIGEKSLSKRHVVPLPSWWHLPSEAVTTALALVLLLFGKNPCGALDRLACPHLEPRKAEPVLSGAPVQIFGFSAGSYTGILAYRLLVEREHLLRCRFDAGVLGAICFHPIMFYDFFLRENNAPLKAADQGLKSRDRAQR